LEFAGALLSVKLNGALAAGSDCNIGPIWAPFLCT
jgi:hypothetical protein